MRAGAGTTSSGGTGRDNDRQEILMVQGNSPLELRIPPVAVVIIAGAAMWFSARLTPALQLSIPAAGGLAASLVLAGFVVAILGVREFRKARTTVDPRSPEKAESLVTAGIFRYSRNPMYLGLLCVLLGWAVFLSNWLAFLFVPVFLAYMNRFQIRPEERHMLHRFGEAYGRYRAAVRRWL